MYIRSIKIRNYKSIADLKIPLASYGNRHTKSSTTILAGINESGKSNILEAINLIPKGFTDLEYESICHKTGQKDQDYVDLYVELVIENQEFYRKKLRQFLPNANELVDKFSITKLVKNIYLGVDGDANSAYEFKLKTVAKLDQYVSIESQETIDDITRDFTGIQPINKDLPESDKKNILNQKRFEKICLEIIKPNLNASIPKITYWKATPDYLINESISLSEFKEDNSISIPIKNIFHIYGKTTSEEIKETIEKAMKSASSKAELQDSLSESLTKHVNKIWKEHKINLNISLDGDLCSVHIEDKINKYQYYNMNQRSDGFRQFISLILSLSAETESEVLTNNLILLDEPEVHLHPSGIRFMRDELLKIGKKNQVIVATHSHYMIDTKTMDRHWIVQKDTSTKINQLNESTNLADEEVLSKAFGLDLMRELLPKNIMLVEGLSDKLLIEHLMKFNRDNGELSIKHAGGGSKVYSIASILADENVPAIIILDDDEEGNKVKKDITSRIKGSYSSKSVFTLRNILEVLPPNSTIEDLYPEDILKSIFKENFKKELVLIKGKPVSGQMVSQENSLKGKENKERLDKFKTQLSNEFLTKFDSKIKLKKSCPQAWQFAEELSKKLDAL
ncbi:MAG: AAA family ATPase [Roseivirga sp.]|nr:AAA family ATPase [Roseivirga sp.]